MACHLLFTAIGLSDTQLGTETASSSKSGLQTSSNQALLSFHFFMGMVKKMLFLPFLGKR
jgi:hypothetical protein